MNSKNTSNAISLNQGSNSSVSKTNVISQGTETTTITTTFNSTLLTANSTKGTNNSVSVENFTLPFSQDSTTSVEQTPIITSEVTTIATSLKSTILTTIENEIEKSDRYLIIIAVLLTIVVLVFLCIGIFCFYKRKQKKQIFDKDDKIRIKRPIHATEFVHHVEEFSKDSNLKFLEDYGELKRVRPKENECNKAAELLVNREKNRFVDVLPYDNTRVHLSAAGGDEGSDYINANYVRGYHSEREYIACQGPLPSTTDDFWRMIWEKKCRVIVMMTKFKEKNKEKCHNYMPEGEDSTPFGDLEISIKKNTVSELGQYTETELVIDYGNQTRSIKHFNYLEWLDKTAPSDYEKLIDFLRRVREEIDRSTIIGHLPDPVCVHCSAGVGRTGCFIVLDRCLQQLRDNPKLNMYIDIYGMVWEMRQSRCLLVQTEDQYALVHKCISYAIEYGYHEIRSLDHYYTNGRFSNDMDDPSEFH